MPYDWTTEADGARRLRLRPHRSLPRRGFVWFIGLTAAMLLIPLLAVLGRPVLWGLLPFILAALVGVWWAISASYRSGETLETLALTRDRISLTRSDPGRPDRQWSANPYWIRALIRPGPVESYLTLVGDHDTGREIELGVFLSPEEREALESELNHALAALRG